MNNMIYELENKMWQAAKSGDKSVFLNLVSADAHQPTIEELEERYS